ncbi:MAG: zinc ribbon domain-containing protein [Oscillospiraceae bacterium]|jgi:hypothetical protein|nr:zinc ribbon domain-containing protein [Oscillospiraceae bacterium]
MAFCTECGTNVPEGIRFCTECGKEMTPSAQPEQVVAATSTIPERQTPPPVQPTPPRPQTAYQPPTQPVYAAQGGNPPPKGSKYAVMGTLAYIGHCILFGIPIVGFVLAIIWSFSSKINHNRRNLARAVLILTVIGIIAGILIAIAATAWINSLLDYLRENVDGQFGSWKDILDWLKNLGDQLPNIPTR